MKQDMSVVDIDIAKRVFHVIGLDDRGQIVMRKRLNRGEVIPFIAKLPRGTVGIDACGGAPYWSRFISVCLAVGYFFTTPQICAAQHMGGAKLPYTHLTAGE